MRRKYHVTCYIYQQVRMYVRTYVCMYVCMYDVNKGIIVALR